MPSPVYKEKCQHCSFLLPVRKMLHVTQTMAAEGKGQRGILRTVKSSPTAVVIPFPHLISLPWKMNWIFLSRAELYWGWRGSCDEPETCREATDLCTSVAALTQLLLEPNLPLVQFLILQQQEKSHQFLLWVAKGNGCVRKFNTHASINLLDE